MWKKKKRDAQGIPFCRTGDIIPRTAKFFHFTASLAAAADAGQKENPKQASTSVTATEAKVSETTSTSVTAAEAVATGTQDQ